MWPRAVRRRPSGRRQRPLCRLHVCRARARCARVLWTGPASSEGSLRERKAALAASGWPLRLRVRFIATCQCLCHCPAAQHARGARPRCRRKTLQPRTPGPGKALHRAASSTPSERASAPDPCGAAEAAPQLPRAPAPPPLHRPRCRRLRRVQPSPASKRRSQTGRRAP